MAELVAFAPKAGVHPTQLGAIFVNDQIEVNVRELTDKGHDGVFVVPVTSPAVAKLDAYDAVKRAQVPENAPALDKVPDGGLAVTALKKRGGDK
jgi:hypothetical protein